MILSKPLSLRFSLLIREDISCACGLTVSALPLPSPLAPLSLTVLGFSRRHLLPAHPSLPIFLGSPHPHPQPQPQQLSRDDSDLCISSPHSLLSLRSMFPAACWASWLERPTGTSHSTQQNPSSSSYPNSTLHPSGYKSRKQLNFSLQPFPPPASFAFLFKGSLIRHG